MGNHTPFLVAFMAFFVAFFALLSMFAYKPMAEEDQTRKVHIVYLGEKQHASKLTTESRHELLATVFKEMSSESMVYRYRHGFSGFAAKLTKSQAQKLAEMPGVVRVFPNALYKKQTTRSWDFLGLTSSPSDSNLLHHGNMGDDVIIGVVDSGIWPELKAFSDEGLGLVPSRWKGICESGEEFNSTNCNRKIIGARWFLKGFIADFGRVPGLSSEYLSPRDANGHGTHAASTAAGSFVANVSYKSLGTGTMRGGAPRARLAIYKTLWTSDGSGSTADILKAIDQAIHDGVDVLSLSLGDGIPLYPEFSEHNGIAIGSFHANARGISVVFAAGNDGPNKQTVFNTAPWVLTVAASSMDRAFLASITLGNNSTYLGQSLFSAKKDIVGELTCSTGGRLCGCEGISANDTSLSGKVVLCFATLADSTALATAAVKVKGADGAGLIIAGQHDDILFPCGDDFACMVVDPDIGTKIFFYMLDDSNAMVKLKHARTIIGNPISAKIAQFSSRGPNSAAPAILKPDIAAPGSNILAAISPDNAFSDDGFALQSGTSMAAPHISGIVALLKALHPTWSPAAIKSAIITTAWARHPSGAPILAEGSPPKVADPFDYGGGVVNPNAAGYPGLVYDMGTADYVYYLCAMGYDGSHISKITEQKTDCPSHRPSLSDVNLPTITIPELRNPTTVTRTVTNVGNSTSTYRALIEHPPGTEVTVEPLVLAFNSRVKKISFKLTISATLYKNYGYSFGTLTWTDGVHLVKSPLSVRIDFL